MPFLKRLISISRLIVEVLNDQNLSTELNLANWFSSYAQFCSGGHFSERAEVSRKCGEVNHLKFAVFNHRKLFKPIASYDNQNYLAFD